MKQLLLFFFAMFSLLVGAQSVDFTLKGHANKNYSVSINNGLKSDTITRGRLNSSGQGKIILPLKYKGVPAMGSLNVGDIKPIELIFNNEDFTFEMSNKGSLQFSGSRENDLLHNRPKEVMNDENKSTFVYAYVKMLNAIVRLSNVIQQPDKASLFDKTNAKLAVLNDIDVDKLYYTRFWFFAIDGLLRLSAGQKGFAQDIIRLIDKTKTQIVFVALVEDVIMIVNQYGLDDAFDIIIPHVQKMGRIQYPQGAIYDAFAMAKVIKGSKAPAIEGLKAQQKGTNDKFTLLVFHQPGCDNCHEQLAILNSRIGFFSSKRVRIVSISGALDKNTFGEEAKTFVWSDRLCDYKGFGGKNFMNYGVTATPTLYLIDSSNVILKRFARVADVEVYLRGIQE